MQITIHDDGTNPHYKRQSKQDHKVAITKLTRKLESQAVAGRKLQLERVLNKLNQEIEKMEYKKHLHEKYLEMKDQTG